MRRLSFFVLFAVLAAAMRVHAAGAPEAPANFVLRDTSRPLPEIAFADGRGKIGALSDFRGKFVLLNIWATWCLPCRKEMPTLDRLEGQLGGPDFEVVALSIDRKGIDVVRKFYSEVGIQHLAALIDVKAEAPAALNAFGVPTTLLIDRQGQEIGRLIGPAEWDLPEMISFLRTEIAKRSGQPPSAAKQEEPK